MAPTLLGGVNAIEPNNMTPDMTVSRVETALCSPENAIITRHGVKSQVAVTTLRRRRTERGALPAAATLLPVTRRGDHITAAPNSTLSYSLLRQLGTVVRNWLRAFCLAIPCNVSIRIPGS